jgi:16S rRNA (cytidine1402-2'-O)-methyltransferase
VTSVVVVVVTGGSATQPANPNSASKQKGILISFLLFQFVLAEQFGFVRTSSSSTPATSDGTKPNLIRLLRMLYVVATPIGNLGDITLRALEVLKLADTIAAEDTRYSGMLLKHFEIKKRLVSFHEHNEAMRTAQLIDRLAAGENIALVTDAGMPGLSDPGARLIRECIRRDLPFTIVPGPSSILTAIVGSGFSTEKFFFGGFLPVKSGGRERELRDAASRDETTVFFESPYRLTKTLSTATDILQDRQLCVARELTKKFEEFRRGSAAELLAHYQAHPPKGEIVLLVQGAAA